MDWANIAIHLFFFIGFFVFLGLLVQALRQNKELKQALLPLLGHNLHSPLPLPKRSSYVRTLRLLEELYQEKYGVKLQIVFKVKGQELPALGPLLQLLFPENTESPKGPQTVRFNPETQLWSLRHVQN